jgi:micrococcal nuclease
MQPEYIYKAKLKRVVDGDTVDLIVDADFYISVHQRFRLKGIDTLEIFGVRKDSVQYKRGIAAKEYV